MRPPVYRVLGPLQLRVDSTESYVKGVRARTVLVMLLLNPGAIVSGTRLIDALYGDEPPPSAANQIQVAINQLRRQTPHPIVTHKGLGYQLEANPLDIDANLFEYLLTRARAAVQQERFEDAAISLRDALDLWRGPAFDGLDALAFTEEATRLDELRIVARELRIRADLALGRSTPLVAELRTLVADYPLRERFHAQLIQALYTCGRQSEALEAYRQARRTLVEQGLEPGDELQTLHERVLNHDPALVVNLHQAIPRQLPPRPRLLVGRSAERDALQQACTETNPLILITGPSGIGKTTLALDTAHSFADRFSDGQLFARLDAETDPCIVLGSFLRALGMRGESLPAELEGRMAAFRSLTADRRYLVVLDEAANSRQIRPLLPAGADCAAIVTSRSPLGDVHASARVALGPLSPSEAWDLLVGRLRSDRLNTEPTPAKAVIRCCGGSPFALDIVATRMLSKPHWSIQRVADRLAEQPLEELSDGRRSVRVALELSRQSLTPAAHHLFRRIGGLRPPSMTLHAAAALQDVCLNEAERQLEELADAHLLAAHPGHDGQLLYHCHDLALAYASELHTSDADLRDAAGRVFGALLATIDAVYAGMRYTEHAAVRRTATRRRSLEPMLPTPSYRWLETNLPHIMWATRRAAELGLSDYCWELATGPIAIFESCGYLREWREMLETALSCVRDNADRQGEAVLLRQFGLYALKTTDLVDAERMLVDSLRLFESLADLHGQGVTTRHLATIAWHRGDNTSARSLYRTSVSLMRRTSDSNGLVASLCGLGGVTQECDLVEEALGIAREIGNVRAQTRALIELGRLKQADGTLRAAADLARSMEDQSGLAEALLELGTIQSGHDAYPALIETVETAHTAGDCITRGRALLTLAERHASAGRLKIARADAAAARQIFTGLRANAWVARATDILDAMTGTN